MLQLTFNIKSTYSPMKQTKPYILFENFWRIELQMADNSCYSIFHLLICALQKFKKVSPLFVQRLLHKQSSKKSGKTRNYSHICKQKAILWIEWWKLMLKSICEQFLCSWVSAKENIFLVFKVFNNIQEYHNIKKYWIVMPNECIQFAVSHINSMLFIHQSGLNFDFFYILVVLSR